MTTAPPGKLRPLEIARDLDGFGNLVEIAFTGELARRGIARRLIEAAIAHARTNGATACILDVRTDNAPAYALYTNLGFVHYDGTSEYKLETITDRPAPPLPPGYSIRPWKRAAWRVGYKLALAETPARAQEFLPVREGEYRTALLQRTLGPFLMRLQGLDQHRYVVVHGDRPVATLRLIAQRGNKGTHDIHVQFDPAHREAVAAPLISQALALLTGYPTRNVLITVRTEFSDLINVLEAYGFTPIEHTHRLGLKLTD